MAAKKPIQANPSVGDSISLGEFAEDEFIAIEDGGTGAVDAAGARTNLEVYSVDEINALLYEITEW